MTKNNDIDNLINRLVNASDKAEKLALYKEWAESYDNDVASRGYVAPEKTAELLEKYQPNKLSKIYDAGCGTGRVGSSLAKLGYTQITGEDFSEPMLEVAKLSGHYQELNTADYTQAIKQGDNYFDAVVCIGVYSQEFKAILLDELVRIVKPGGHIVLSCRPVHFDNGAKPEVKALVRSEQVTLISETEELYMREHNAKAWFMVLKVI